MADRRVRRERVRRVLLRRRALRRRSDSVRDVRTGATENLGRRSVLGDVIERAHDGVRAALQQMRVDLRGANISVTELLLHGADVRAARKQMRCKRVPKRMATRLLVDSRTNDRRPYRLLQPAFVHVMTANGIRSRINRS